MKYVVVATVALLLGLFAVTNTEILTQTFSPEETLVAKISLTGKDGKISKDGNQEETAQAVKNKSILKTDFCLFSSPISTIETIGPIIINEVAWMGDLEDFSNEWIEIKNISNTSLNISGWQLIDKDEQIKIYFPDYEIDAQEFYLLKRGKDYVGNLRNSDEGIRLFNDKCYLVDEVFANPDWPAGDNKNKFTMERNGRDFSWYTSSIQGGTPNKENSPRPVGSISPINPTNQTSTLTSAPITETETNLINPTSSINPIRPIRILISEIMVGIEGNADYEFIELYNPSSETVDLSGWAIKKRSSSGNEYPLVAASRLEGKIISPNSYFLIIRGGSGIENADLEWPSSSSYALAYTNNALYLYKASGEVEDSVSWTEIPKGSSFERVSWDENLFKIQPHPNPRGSK